MQAAKSDESSVEAPGVRFSSNNAAAAGAMIGAVGAGVLAPVVGPVLVATALGFGIGKIVGMYATGHERPIEKPAE